MQYCQMVEGAGYGSSKGSSFQRSHTQNSAHQSDPFWGECSRLEIVGSMGIGTEALPVCLGAESPEIQTTC